MRLYDKRRWRRRAKLQLAAEPLCAICLRKGIITAATAADHVEPHKHDPQKFWFGRLQSLCDRCHNTAKQLEERYGYDLEVGLNGEPTDPRHPWYRR
jgi:5-methylcytosine-specific restriction endonuclease McrA